MRTSLALLPLALTAALAGAAPSTAATAAADGATELRLDLMSGAGGLRAYAPDSSSRAVPLAGLAAAGPVFSLTASRGGDRIITLEADPRAGDRDRESRVVVRDITGAVVGVPDRVTTRSIDPQTQQPSTVLTGQPALSPDGGAAAGLRQRFAGCALDGTELRLSDAKGTATRVLQTETGTPTARRGLSEVTFLDQDTLVIGVGKPDYSIDECFVRPIADTFRTVTRAGAIATLTGLDSSVDDERDEVTTNGSLAFSPDGSRVAFVRSVSGGYGASPIGLFTAPVTRTGNALVVGTPVSLGAGTSPSFSRDGSTVLFARDGVPVTVPALGGPATALHPRDADALTYRTAYASRESVAPSAPTSVGTPTRTGSTATVPFAVATDDPTASRVRVTRTSPGLPPLVREAVLPATSLLVPGLVSGRSYAFAVQVVDRSGNVGPAVTVTSPATAPAAAVRVSGQQLGAGQQLTADTGHRLRLGTDGNLVAYSPTNRVLFQTRTRGTNASLVVQGDGNLALPR